MKTQTMKQMKSKYISLLAVALALLTAGTSPADMLTLQPVDDSTISTITGEPDTPFGNADQLAMTGWLDIGARRPLLKFDLSPIPDGWTLLSAVLTLQLVYIHPTSWPTFASEAWRMPNDNWVEATVTWNSYDQTGAVAVATNVLDAAIGPRVWNIRIADWNYAEDLLDNAVTFQTRWGLENNQWLKHVAYSSKEGTVVPTFRIEYLPCPADVTGDGVVNVRDLLAVIKARGPCSGCAADINDDGVVNVKDLLAVINAWGPCP